MIFDKRYAVVVFFIQQLKNKGRNRLFELDMIKKHQLLILVTNTFCNRKKTSNMNVQFSFVGLNPSNIISKTKQNVSC